MKKKKKNKQTNNDNKKKDWRHSVKEEQYLQSFPGKYQGFLCLAF